MEDEKLVSAKVVCDRYNLPRHILYSLVGRGDLKAYEQPREYYHKRRRLLFKPSEVEAALRQLRESREPYTS